MELLAYIFFRYSLLINFFKPFSINNEAKSISDEVITENDDDRLAFTCLIFLIDGLFLITKNKDW